MVCEADAPSCTNPNRASNMKPSLSIAVMAACLAFNSTASRAADDDWQACANIKDQTARISACTALIEDPAATADNRVKALLNRADAYRAMSDGDHAIADLSEILQAHPSHYAATFRRGIVYLNKRDNDHAIADFDQAILITPQSGEAFLNRAFAYRNKHDFGRAIADFSSALAANTLNPFGRKVAFFNRGTAY
jgi:tetratricopeptide (TPR) repeat protein